jgi:hypothetical protein
VQLAVDPRVDLAIDHVDEFFFFFFRVRIRQPVSGLEALEVQADIEQPGRLADRAAVGQDLVAARILAGLFGDVAMMNGGRFIAVTGAARCPR